MVTLETCVANAKCRKGPADGTTKRGAYWLACEPITIRRAGGDGIGQSAADVTYTLELRHYRNGEVRFLVGYSAHHQNYDHDGYMCVQRLGKCTTVEQVICALKGTRYSRGEGDYDGDHVYGDYHEDTLTAGLVALGMAIAESPPDDTEEELTLVCEQMHRWKVSQGSTCPHCGGDNV